MHEACCILLHRVLHLHDHLLTLLKNKINVGAVPRLKKQWKLHSKKTPLRFLYSLKLFEPMSLCYKRVVLVATIYLNL